VLISLFTSGLKTGLELGDRRWLLAVRLAVISMIVTVGLVAASAMALLGLSLGAAVLLGGLLAPTDPVLAADVNVADPDDRDRLRVSLTGEAGLNDGTAGPAVMLGLGLLNNQSFTQWGWHWFYFDVVWATASGLLIGAASGVAIGHLVLYFRRRHKEGTGLDNFLALGLIALSYGLAQMVGGYGFLAVFAAGVALRRVERRQTSKAQDDNNDSARRGKSPEKASEIDPTSAEAQTHPDLAPAYLAHAMLDFNQQLDRIAEAAVVVAVGLLLWAVEWRSVDIWFVALLLIAIRPAAVVVGLMGARVSALQRRLIGWFGIRGIGSLYYLAYASNHGLDQKLSQTLTAIVFSVIAASIVLHGISVTPLMARYEKRKSAQRA
jgi:NhaP-type Na+/H+ or K+/H+ antiporter